MARDGESHPARSAPRSSRDNLAGLSTKRTAVADSQNEARAGLGTPPPLPEHPPQLELISLSSPDGGSARFPRHNNPPLRKDRRHAAPGKPETSPPSSGRSDAMRSDALPDNLPRPVVRASERVSERNSQAPRLVLPNPLESPSQFQRRVRRTESVLAEAAAANHRLRGIAQKASIHLGDLVSSGLGAAERLRDGSYRFARRFEEMPKKKKVVWVALPYAVVLVLVLVFFNIKGTSRAATIVEPNPEPLEGNIAVQEAAPLNTTNLEAKGLVEPARQEALLAPKTETTSTRANEVERRASEPRVDASESAKAESESAKAASEAEKKKREANPSTEAPPKTASAEADKKKVLAETWLRTRAASNAQRTLRLKPGTQVVAHPEFKSPTGWVLVELDTGDIGFVKLGAFSEHKIKKKSQRKTAKGRSSSAAQLAIGSGRFSP